MVIYFCIVQVFELTVLTTSRMSFMLASRLSAEAYLTIAVSNMAADESRR